MFLEYELVRYPVCISITVTDKCAPIRTFHFITFNTLYHDAYAKPFALINLYRLDFIIQVVHGNMPYLAFGIIMILLLLEIGKFHHNLH